MKLLLLLALFGSDVSDLSSDSFDRRERASARLASYLPLTYPLLDRPFSDPEASVRARRLRESYLPASYPSLDFLCSDCTLEWGTHGQQAGTICPQRPSELYLVIWTKPGRCLYWPLVRLYTERARTQYEWKDWTSANDGREATRLLVSDLKNLGTPPVALRAFLRILESRERRLLEGK